MATASGVVVDADSRDDPGVIVQQFGEERGQGLVAVKSFSKAQTIFREKVIVNSFLAPTSLLNYVYLSNIMYIV